MGSAFDAEFEEAADDLDAAFGQSATYVSPDPLEAVAPCTATVMDLASDEDVSAMGHRRTTYDIVIKLRRAEVASPQKGGEITITGGDTFIVRDIAMQDEAYTTLMCVRTKLNDGAAQGVVDARPNVNRRRR